MRMRNAMLMVSRMALSIEICSANIYVYEGDANADFIAKAELNSGTTDAGTLKGKFEYMSPEQARGEDIDGCSTYSLWHVA